MTDRELLEKAAKACGLPECGWMGPAFMYVKGNTFTDWNPLTDDGDAFRLAVKLGLSVECNNYRRQSGVVKVGSLLPAVQMEDHGADAAAATRRAIVRAAAALGDRT